MVAGDPFAALIWPRQPRHTPDPFTEDERDQILEYFARQKAHYYPFVLLLFWTGVRPSEAVGLRWSDLDLRRRKLIVRRSRVRHEENAPKTAHSERTIELAQRVVHALAKRKPLRVTDEEFVFTNLEGRPIFPDPFVQKHWHSALRVLNIRPRKFYATRHTFISAGLGRGVHIKWLAEYCGTSVAMIERHYGRYLRGDSAMQLGLLENRDTVPISEVDAGKIGSFQGSGKRRKIAKRR